MSARPFRFRRLVFSLLILTVLALLGLYESLFTDLSTPDALLTRVSLVDVPPYLQQATVSPRAIVRALYLNARQGGDRLWREHHHSAGWQVDK